MHAVRLLPLALHLFASATPQAAASQEDLGAKSRRGTELMAAGRYAEAVPVYRELVQAVPGNPGLLLNLGMALHLAGQDQAAVAELQKALRLQPDSLPAALFLGIARLRLGQAAEAVAPLQKAVRLQPDNGDARGALAEALLGLGRYREAEPHLVRLSTLAPKDPATWFNLGKAYEELAAQAFDDLGKQDPESAFVLALLAESRLKQGRRNVAFHLYRQALGRSPTLRGLHASIAGIYRSAGHADWAQVEEERERRLGSPDCARETLECRFSAGKYREVVAAASKSKAPEVCYWLVRACNELAAEAFTRLGALPPSAQSHEWMAQTHASAGRYAESAEQWRQAMALAPGQPRLRMELAVTLRLNRDFARAQEVLEELARALPDAAEPHYLLGDVLVAQQQPERAIPFLEKAVGIEPGEAHAHGALGRAYALVGRAPEAIKHLEQALPTDTDGSLRYQLARSYQATGQTEKAQRALKDYEEFRKASSVEPEAYGQGAPITPP